MEPCLLKRWRRSLVGPGVAAALAAYARPAWDILVFVFEKPLSDHGTVSFAFASDHPEEVRIVALRLEQKLHESGEMPERSNAVPGPAGPAPYAPGSLTRARFTVMAGRQRAELLYRNGDDDVIGGYAFDVDVIAQHECTVRVNFGADGVRASSCGNPRPGSYGGTWPH